MAKEVYCGEKRISNGRKHDYALGLRHEQKESILTVTDVKALKREGIDPFLKDWLKTQPNTYKNTPIPALREIYDIWIEYDSNKEQFYTFSNAGKEGMFTAGIISQNLSKVHFSPSLEGKL